MDDGLAVTTLGEWSQTCIHFRLEETVWQNSGRESNKLIQPSHYVSSLSQTPHRMAFLKLAIQSLEIRSSRRFDLRGFNVCVLGGSILGFNLG